jgi:Lrp/AsnC family transcriptional regulator, regulator for asnA, asnC and gidA
MRFSAVAMSLDQTTLPGMKIYSGGQLEEVTEIHTPTGNVNAFVCIWARDMEHLREILYDKFTNIPGIIRTNTIIVLDMQSKPLPLPVQDTDR